MDSVVQFLAVLAYPHVLEKNKRDPLAEAFHAMLHKACYWKARSSKNDSVSLRTHIPEQYRRRTNRKYQNLVNKGMRRISHRITVGNVAARFLVAGIRVPYSSAGENSLSFPANPWEGPIRLRFVTQGNTPEGQQSIGMELRGPETLRDALRAVVKAKEQGQAVFVSEDDAIENYKKQIWLPSMPVLHLAVAIFEELCRYPNPEAPYGFGDAGEDGSRLVANLVWHPEWLAPALVRAESYRSILPERIPGGDFNPTKALRLLPQ